MKSVAVLCLAGAWFAQALPLHAEDVTARNLAATCTGCHGTGGASAGDIPSLAGVSKDELLKMLREFRAGTRNGTIMQQNAKGYSDAQLEAIAGWFAEQGK